MNTETTGKATVEGGVNLGTVNVLKALGVSGAVFQGLERILAHRNLHAVTMTSDEVTALCPVTGQPDFYTVAVKFNPAKYAIESKSLKLYLQSIREAGEFCEDMAARMAQEIANVVEVPVQVEITQKPRGGVGIKAIGGAVPLPEGIDKALDTLQDELRKGNMSAESVQARVEGILGSLGIGIEVVSCENLGTEPDSPTPSCSGGSCE